MDRFSKYGTDTILDAKLGLEWKGGNKNFLMTWDEAKAYCTNLKGHWYLPSLYEFVSLMDYVSSTPDLYYWEMFDSIMPVDYMLFYYWTRDTYPNTPGQHAWAFDLREGTIGAREKQSKLVKLAVLPVCKSPFFQGL